LANGETGTTRRKAAANGSATSMVVGSGKPALPTDTRADLELLDERQFENGAVRLRYRPLAW
jgi:hypothetical protein